MVVFSNHRLGPSAELLLSPEVAIELLRATADAARPVAAARWEHELVRWLDERARAIAAIGDATIDVGEIAWTPENFDRQRAFVISAIARAQAGSEHARALARWERMVDGHPRDSVQVGRRWMWPGREITA